MAEEKKKVRIYSTPTCPYCKMVKEFLTEKGVKFEDVDVSSDQEAAHKMVEKSGQMGVPQIEIDGEIKVIGFDKEKLEKELDL